MVYLKYPFLLVLLWVAVANGVKTQDFFPDTSQNLTKITWAHAVNNQTYLKNTLQNEKINMIEADIIIGKLINGTEDIPIMAHTAGDTSDLSLEDFLQQVQDFNAKNTSRKGIKLDFKSTETFTKSVEIVTKFDKGDYPIWINADILPGPINATNDPVDAKTFLNGTKSFPNSLLSIGWTTNYGSDSSGSYEVAQINKMISTIGENDVTQEITFPVRAGLAAESKELMVNLTVAIKNSTLTIWSSENDKVDVEHLRVLIKAIGIDKTYIDVPSDLLDQLHLDNLPDGNRATSNKLVLAVYLVASIVGLRNIFQNIFDRI